MTKRELLIDAMAGIDEDLLVTHIQKKHPTRTQKIRRYVGAALVYAAACLVVAIVLPFLIGHDSDPKPTPGVTPIITETHSPVTDDPEAKQIHASDIYETYCDIDPDNLSDSVTLDEVKEIIAAAQKAYADYDIIILQDDTPVVTTPKEPDVTFSDLKDSGEDGSKVSQLTEYNYQVYTVIRDVLDSRFPDEAKEYSRDPEYYEYETEEDSKRSEHLKTITLSYMSENEYEEISLIRTSAVFTVTLITQVEDEASTETVLYPSEKDYQILCNRHNSIYYYSKEPLPMTTSEFDGLELSVLLGKNTYLVNEDVGATVILENTGDEAVTLYQGYIGDYLDDVVFLENGEERPYFSEVKGFDEAWHGRLLEPGEYIIHSVTFRPFNPYDSSAEPVSMDSLWEIEASVQYVPHPPTDDYNSAMLFDELKTGTVRINVPHDTDDDVVPDPDEMRIGSAGKNGSFIREDNYYPCELMYRRVNEALSEDETIRVYCDVDIDAIRENGPYAEFVYNTAKTVRLKDWFNGNDGNTEPLRRICFTQMENDFVMILSRDEAYTDIYGVYSITDYEDILAGIKNVAEKHITEKATTTPPPEATTTTTMPIAEPEPATTTAPPAVKPVTAVTSQKPVAPETTAVTEDEPEEEIITYPEPYISNKTTTSVTKILYGCEYTVSLDKAKYEKGDTVTVTVTLENKGKNTLQFAGWTFIGDVNFLVDGNGSALEYHGVVYEDDLLPGETWIDTSTFNTTEARLTAVWSIESNIEFNIDGAYHKDSIEIEVVHDGVDSDAFSPMGLTNPFSGDKYFEGFSETGEIIVIMKHNTSLNWKSYLNSEYLGIELDRVESWIDSEKLAEYVQSNPQYCLFVSIFLKDKSDEAVVDAINKLYSLNKESSFVKYAHPQTARY